jgi:hypothetical protein
MLLSMGAPAQRDHLDLSGTVVDIELSETDKPFPHVDAVTLIFNIPRDFPATDRRKLERATGLCPIKASFRDETGISATFHYAAAKAPGWANGELDDGHREYSDRKEPPRNHLFACVRRCFLCRVVHVSRHHPDLPLRIRL